MCLLCLDQTGRSSPLRVLREWGEGHDVGAYRPSLHAGILCQHSVSELRDWKDYDLEQQGRLPHPLRFDRTSDKYVACSWDEAFASIGTDLKKLDPKSAVFYASGRASLETSCLYACWGGLPRRRRKFIRVHLGLDGGRERD